MMCYSVDSAQVDGNRIFGGGYLVIGLGGVSSSANLDIHDNFVHLRSGEPDNRWPEYGAMSGANGFRQTWGGTALDIHDNVFSVTASDGGYARGLWVYQDDATSGHQFFDSTFEGGASYDLYNFDGSGSRDFSVGWTVMIATEVGAAVTIRNAADAVVFSGVVDATARIAAPLFEYTRNPAGATYHTAHEVTVELTRFDTAIVDVIADAEKLVSIPLL